MSTLLRTSNCPRALPPRSATNNSSSYREFSMRVTHRAGTFCILPVMQLPTMHCRAPAHRLLQLPSLQSAPKLTGGRTDSACKTPLVGNNYSTRAHSHFATFHQNLEKWLTGRRSDASVWVRISIFKPDSQHYKMHTQLSFYFLHLDQCVSVEVQQKFVRSTNVRSAALNSTYTAVKEEGGSHFPNLAPAIHDLFDFPNLLPAIWSLSSDKPTSLEERMRMLERSEESGLGTEEVCCHFIFCSERNHVQLLCEFQIAASKAIISSSKNAQ